MSKFWIIWNLNEGKNLFMKLHHDFIHHDRADHLSWWFLESIVSQLSSINHWKSTENSTGLTTLNVCQFLGWMVCRRTCTILWLFPLVQLKHGFEHIIWLGNCQDQKTMKHEQASALISQRCNKFNNTGRDTVKNRA